MGKWNLTLCALWLGAGATTTTATAATINVAGVAPASLVITEYFANPIGISDAAGEYFEIFNTTTDTIDLAGLIVRDDGSNAFTVEMLTVAPLSFAVFSSSDGTSLGLVPDYVYGSAMTLTNGADEIGLYRPDDALINKVAYSDGDQFGAGIAHELVALGPTGPVLTFGPALGSDFMAATATLPLGNFGSPGMPGSTVVSVPSIPVPASVWMFGSALSILGWARRRARGTMAPRRMGPRRIGNVWYGRGRATGEPDGNADTKGRFGDSVADFAGVHRPDRRHCRDGTCLI